MKIITILKLLMDRKRKKNFLLLLISLLLVASLPSQSQAAIHPAQDIMYLYAGELPYLNFFEPYTVCILALNELEHKRNVDKVRSFIAWYFENLNYPDRYGINGTIYDFNITRGWAVPTDTYDSIDGYSGIFLHLLVQYHDLTGEKDIIETNWHKIDDIARTIPFLQEGDGLTVALIDTNEKYLTDNCESYGGLTAYIRLREIMELEPSPSFEVAKERIKAGIFKHLYNRKKKIFSFLIEDDEVNETTWERYYPDAYGQFFVIYYEVAVDKPKIMKHIWQNFTSRYGHKESKFPIEQRIMYQLTKNKIAREYPYIL